MDFWPSIFSRLCFMDGPYKAKNVTSQEVDQTKGAFIRTSLVLRLACAFQGSFIGPKRPEKCQKNQTCLCEKMVRHLILSYIVKITTMGPQKLIFGNLAMKFSI